MKKTKKLLSIVLVVILILSAVPLGAFTLTARAATEYISGNFKYTVSSNKATITGCVDDTITELILPKTIAGYKIIAIGPYAFRDCSSLTDVWYGATKDDAERIVIEYENDDIAMATWHYEICEYDEHKYLSNCDTSCENCSWIRNSEYSHLYTSTCDKTCNECGKTRSVSSHNHAECFDGYTEELYGDWDINITKTGVYTLKPNSKYTGEYNIHNIAVYDKNGNEVKYNESKQGFPLVKDQQYTVKFRYDCSDEISGTITWNLTKKANTIFPDTSASEWYNDAVTYAVGRGIMTGYANNGKFGTSDGIQRQDFLVMLARFDGVDLTQYATKHGQFPDVAKNSYYEAAVMWGYENEIVTGYDNGKFGVGDKVTREQLVTFLYRYAKYKGYDYSYTSDRETVVSGQYNDYKNVSAFAKDSILWAIEKGVISGKTSTTIAPQGNAQRCEVAKIMYNIYLNDIFN